MPVYGATRLDAMTVRTGGGVYAFGDDDNGLGPVVGWVVAVPLLIIDTPVSLVTDTAFLPWDLYRIRHEERGDPPEPWLLERTERHIERSRSR